MPDARAVAESVYKEEAGKIIATLIRLSGSFDLAEEALAGGARVRAGDLARTRHARQSCSLDYLTGATQANRCRPARNNRRNKANAVAHHIESWLRIPSLSSNSDDIDMLYPDDRLRLIFTCCHPALAVDAQVALTLADARGISDHRNRPGIHCSGADAGAAAGAGQAQDPGRGHSL